MKEDLKETISRKKKVSNQLYRSMLTVIPGITDEIAQSMIKQYGALENLVWHICNRKRREGGFLWWKKVEGMSAELADQIYRFFEFQDWIGDDMDLVEEEEDD